MQIDFQTGVGEMGGILEKMSVCPALRVLGGERDVGVEVRESGSHPHCRASALGSRALKTNVAGCP